MKKTYMNPSVKEVKIRMEQHVCAGSPGAGFDPTSGNGSDESAKDDDLDFDTWGW